MNYRKERVHYNYGAKQMRREEPNRSFKFALTILTAIGTIIYTSYYYFQTSTLHDSVFHQVMAFITTLFIFSFFLITYVLIVGFSTMVEGYKIIQIKLPIINKLAFSLYFIVFSIWIALSIPYILVILAIPFANLSAILFIILFLLLLKRISFSKSNSNIAYFIMIVCILFLAGFYFSYVPISVLFQGRVEINMDNEYYKDSTPIPVSIEITGRRTESTITLYKKNSVNELT